jgi:hypothetical protein
MTTIDRTGASDTEFETRIAPFEADALAEALVDELAGHRIGSGYYATTVGTR